ncbi:hypothetical protein PHLGIDRAFT_167748 [Phlebiopsis gigantea 11061_1 CR5-6]|uniref:Uncharacterized protein n=1 Tax=Phlebiopsis gigantea (strain 11061_1 CR5-6) TaxID=745531 RepID=A0A0C3RV66_PHLG1|nr:hypothetical protein PHLGIDRAFT_167748 [Phlebiopsis gigantea 11061_1 CR5-6]
MHISMAVFSAIRLWIVFDRCWTAFGTVLLFESVGPLQSTLDTTSKLIIWIGGYPYILCRGMRARAHLGKDGTLPPIVAKAGSTEEYFYDAMERRSGIFNSPHPPGWSQSISDSCPVLRRLSSPNRRTLLDCSLAIHVQSKDAHSSPCSLFYDEVI